MILLYILAVILFLIWAFCFVCFLLIRRGGEEHIKHLSFWQLIDYSFSANVAKGLKGLDILVKTSTVLIIVIWLLF
jgi:hypothetical protein